MEYPYTVNITVNQISKDIVKIVNDTDNDYDAVELIEDMLHEYIDYGKLGKRIETLS